jgi:hypothetical protein
MNKIYDPEYGFFDADPIVYRAGFSSQKTKYFYRDQKGEIVSPLISSAKEAKVWLQDQEEFDLDVSQYTREKTIKHLSEANALKKLDDIIKEYRKMAGPSVKHFKGFLTPSGDKHKAIKGIEDEYQMSRVNTPKPKHHEALKAYAASKDFIIMSPLGFEADELLIHNAEQKGTNGVVISIDKDMCIAEDTWVIHVQKDGSGKPVWNTSLGHLELYQKGTDVKGVGGGFKFLAYQAVAGDRSDHYFGIKGVGAVTVVNLIKDCETHSEVVEACLELYTDTFGESYSFTSWDGQEMIKTPLEMLQMHFEMPYMQRGAKDKGFNINKYL